MSYIDQKPTVGRIVHFYDGNLETQNKPGPHAAIVTAVHSDACCTLAVLVGWRTDVMVASSCMRKDQVGGVGRYWEWPFRDV